MLGRSLLTLFIISFFLHLTSRVPVLGAVRLELLLGCLVLFCTFLTPYADKWRQSIEVNRRLKYFLLYIFASLPLVTWPGSVLRGNLEGWIKVAMFYVFLVALLRTEEQLKWVFGVFMGCQAFRILEPFYLHLTTGYWGSSAHSSVGEARSTLLRLSGAPHDVINPNQLAWVIVTMVPFLFYLLWKGGRLGKLLALLAAPPFLYCLLLTGSRSGLLSLIVTLLAICFFSKRRVKNLVVLAVFVIPVAIYSFGSLGSGMQTRYLSLIDDTVAGADTAQGRVDGWVRGIRSITNNPLFGNGMGTCQETNVNVLGGRAQITHNLYIEILQEVGMIGLTLFMLFIIAIFKSLKETKRLMAVQGQGEKGWLFRLATATQVWVVMDLFYSMSCYGLRSWEWYFFGGIAATCHALARECAVPAEVTTKNCKPASEAIYQNPSTQSDRIGNTA
jgi:O-antigen ligase